MVGRTEKVVDDKLTGTNIRSITAFERVDVGTNLLTTILSCCFCCGLQSEKSKLRFHVDNDVYEIVQMTPYDE